MSKPRQAEAGSPDRPILVTEDRKSEAVEADGPKVAKDDPAGREIEDLERRFEAAKGEWEKLERVHRALPRASLWKPWRARRARWSAAALERAREEYVRAWQTLRAARPPVDSGLEGDGLAVSAPPRPGSGETQEAIRRPPAAKGRRNSASPAPGLDGSRISLTDASFEQLREIGLSATQAARVISYREAQDGFSNVDDLDAVPGLPEGLRERLKQALAP